VLALWLSPGAEQLSIATGAAGLRATATLHQRKAAAMLDSGPKNSMPFSYVIYREHHLVVSTGSDRVTWEEIKDRQDQTKTDADFNPEFNQIVDLRAVTGFDMTSDQARMLARRMIFSSTSRRAFVAANPAIFGVGRMWEVFSELSQNPSQIRVFYDLLSALKWLSLESLPQ
jgi:hypothetical protein